MRSSYRGAFCEVLMLTLSLAITFSQNICAMEALSENEMGIISGQGLSFNLEDFSLSGDLSVTYTNSSDDQLKLSNIAVSRSDDDARKFTDPYRIFLSEGSEGFPDSITITAPRNIDSLIGWNFSSDLSNLDAGNPFEMGAVSVANFRNFGSSLSLSSPIAGEQEGVIFGASVSFNVDQIGLYPVGIDDEIGSLIIEGLRLLGDNDDVWQIADLRVQPGRVAVIREGDNTELQILIDWPKSQSDSGQLHINNVKFNSNQSNFVDHSRGVVGSEFNIGNSKIGSMQIQYMNLRLRPGS